MDSLFFSPVVHCCNLSSRGPWPKKGSTNLKILFVTGITYRESLICCEEFSEYERLAGHSSNCPSPGLWGLLKCSMICPFLKTDSYFECKEQFSRLLLFIWNLYFLLWARREKTETCVNKQGQKLLFVFNELHFRGRKVKEMQIYHTQFRILKFSFCSASLLFCCLPPFDVDKLILWLSLAVFQSSRPLLQLEQ